jgi:transglutaminase-like putative cysteine protease
MAKRGRAAVSGPTTSGAATSDDAAAASEEQAQTSWTFAHDPVSRVFRRTLVRRADGAALGEARIEYKPAGLGIVELWETFVPPSMRGRGVAELLAREVWEYCKQAGMRIWPTCTYLANRFLRRNPELQALSVSGGAPLFRSSATVPWSLALGFPAAGRPHLMPFVLPTAFCDSLHPEVAALARRVLPRHCSVAEAASRVRNFVRANIRYALHHRDVRASETLRQGQGMCTNMANLQCALLRAAGVPCGYVLVNIKRDVFALLPGMLPQMLSSISDVTLHCFCAAWDDGSDSFLHFDATEALKGQPERNTMMEENLVTGESRLKRQFLVGPLTPVQANLDHLLSYRFDSTKIDETLRARQNELLAASPQEEPSAASRVAQAAIIAHAEAEHGPGAAHALAGESGGRGQSTYSSASESISVPSSAAPSPAAAPAAAAPAAGVADSLPKRAKRSDSPAKPSKCNN